MSTASKRSTVYFDSELHAALRLKAADTNRSVSELVNEAVRQALTDDWLDLASIEERLLEPTISFEDLLDELKANDSL